METQITPRGTESLTPKTVEVPVELLKDLDRKMSTARPEAVDALVALIPKPKPRLVAVTQKQWDEGDTVGWSFDQEPNLLDTFDSVIDSTPIPGAWVPVLKRKFREKFGVDHD